MVNPLYDVIEFMSDLDDDMADDEMMTSSDSWMTIDTNEYKFVKLIKVSKDFQIYWLLIAVFRIMKFRKKKIKKVLEIKI